MGLFKDICRDVAALPKILTFSDIAKAASNGASCWQNTPGGAWVGAILGVTMEASKRVQQVSHDLMAKADNKPAVTKPKP